MPHSFLTSVRLWFGYYSFGFGYSISHNLIHVRVYCYFGSVFSDRVRILVRVSDKMPSISFFVFKILWNGIVFIRTLSSRARSQISIVIVVAATTIDYICSLTYFCVSLFFLLNIWDVLFCFTWVKGSHFLKVYLASNMHDPGFLIRVTINRFSY